MNNVLLVDKDIETLSLLNASIKENFDTEITTSKSLENTIALIAEGKQFHAAIVEPFLDDDSSGKVVDLLLENSVPVLLYTSPTGSDLFDIAINKPIVDYVIKSSRHNFSIIINLLGHLLKHQQTAVLVIDDSLTSRMQIKDILKNLNLDIIEANGAEEALKKIKEHPEVKLLLTDYNMGGQNGVELTREIRKIYSNKDIAIIGNSSYGSVMLSAEFLKNGANDFINKPFQKEELINRVLVQLDMINYIETLKNATNKDFMTGIFNRKYVYEVGRKLFDNAKRGKITLACAMIDIDHFKKVNDTYGHDIGDKVIIRLAQELTDTFRTSDIVGRLGGEEFCVVLASPKEILLEDIFDNLRKNVEKLVVHGEDEHENKFNISFTVSIGVTAVLTKSFEEMLKYADMKLYEAKNYGRNMVVI